MTENDKIKEQHEEEELNSSEKSIPQWIRELFSQTWDPELLISGIALYGLIQAPDAVRDLFYNLENNTGINLRFPSTLWIIAIYTLILNFTIHLALRGFWIGIIGLNSVFVSGIQYDKLRFQSAFIDRLKRQYGNLQDYSVVIDNICSQIFAFSFLILFSLISISSVLALSFILKHILITYFHLNFLDNFIIFFIIPYYGLAIIYGLDFLFLGILKKNRIVYKIYFPIYWFYSAISLAFIYRPIYYTFISNYSKRKFGLILFLYVFITLFFWINFSTQGLRINVAGNSVSIFKTEIIFEPRNYDNLRSNSDRVGVVCINNDIIERGDYVRIFIPYKSQFNKRIDNIPPVAASIPSVDRDSVFLTKFQTLFRITVNDSIIHDTLQPSLQFRFSRHHITQQSGIIAFIPTRGLDVGENLMVFKYLVHTSFYPRVHIPFWIKEVD